MPKPTYEQLVEALERLAHIADEMIPNENPSNSALADAEDAISVAVRLVHEAKEGE